MAWVYLFGAVVCEAGWLIGLRYVEGSGRVVISVGTCGGMFLGYCLLASAARTLPLSIAYSIWTAGILKTGFPSFIVIGDPFI